ncbi:Transcription factor E2F7 [Portunus trituberculatus]|uniref:Transcription factor E2F7 n=1 Tax=Portunus trituberculatus TaxID=210409 RepID=A0A5B7DYY1_PORTR|nr:Transcription factor E2F7 [Portunus trituberculatus]
MDALTSAAAALFGYPSGERSSEESKCLSPSKKNHEGPTEITNTISISPGKVYKASLQTLFTASPVNYNSSVKVGSSVILPVASSKSVQHSSPLMEAPSPGQEKVLGRSPLTPTSNLKLLTRIASMEESFTSKKMLFNSKGTTISKKVPSQTRPRQKQRLQRYNSDGLSTQQASSKAMTGEKTTLKKHSSTDSHSQGLEGVGHLPPLDEVIARPSEGSRKDKSLGLLSEKFLEHFPLEVSFLETPRRMVIDEVAITLGTERRRVYDIINVLESLNMAARVQKNMYQWVGNMYLEETLGGLKSIALKLNLKAQVEALHSSEGKRSFKVPKWTKTNWNVDGEEKVETRREKSLGILCQKFLMLLLVSPAPFLLSLDDALKMLMGNTCEDGERLRTRGRRLYDIANVLTSLGLVQRIPLAKGFRYIGPQVEAIPSEDDNGPRLRHSLLPSFLLSGDSGGKENISCPGDHDVTPSAAPPPTQKRGRPRKLSTDFSASTIPGKRKCKVLIFLCQVAAKRTKLQRTRSEDITAGKQSRKFIRHPSLHEICQLQDDNIITQNRGFVPSCSASAPILATILNQKPRTKIPVALTFKKSDEEDGKDACSIMPFNVVQKIPSTTRVNTGRTIAQVQSPTHIIKHEQQTNAAMLTPGINRGMTYVATPQSNSKIILKNWPQESSGVPVVPPKEPQGASPSVIRVVTNMGGGMKHLREPPKIFSVIPASQAQSPHMPSAKRFIWQAGGTLQQVPVRNDVNPHLPPSHSQAAEGVCHVSEHEHKLSSYAVYTISGSHAPVTSSAVPKNMTSPVTGERSTLPTECDSTSKPPILYTWTDSTSMPSSGMDGPAGHQVLSGQLPASNCLTSREPARVEWQPSSDASSTDSELEEIFGDCFRFTRPKGLLNGNTSQDGALSKVRHDLSCLVLTVLTHQSHSPPGIITGQL